jgi:hypothetical protein
MKRTLLSLAVLSALGMVSASASALTASIDAKDITINESGIPGSFANVLVADQLSGQYNEIFTTYAPGKFNTIAYFNAGNWFNNSVPVPSQLGGLSFLGGYNLYALFESEGTYTVNSGVSTFTGNSGKVQLWADPDQNSDPKVLPASAYDFMGSALLGIADITVPFSGDDILLGSANLLTFADGSSNFGAGANGNFELIFSDFGLTAAGKLYFVGPSPDFYTVLDLNGNFQALDPTSAVDIQILASSANAFWTKVPEPGSLALLGLALTGMGFSKRRRAS